MRRPHPTHHAMDQALVPAAHALLLMDVANEHGLDTHRLLAEFGLKADDLCQPERWLTVRQCSGLMVTVRERTGLDNLGYVLGMRTPGTAHGLFGLGLLSSATPQDALAFAQRFAQLRNPTFGMSWALDGTQVNVRLLDRMPDGPMRQTATEWVLLSMWRMAEAMMGEADTRAACALSFTWPEPAYHAPHAGQLPPCRFEAPTTGLSFPAPWLWQRLANAAPASVQLARQACERELTLATQAESLVQRVRACMDTGPTPLGYPSREAVADRLSLSVSTLKRQLQQEGSSFSALLNEARLRDAQRLLARADLSVADVAAALGYQNTANFTRAFQQWTGVVPSAWRAGLGLTAMADHGKPPCVFHASDTSNPD